MKHSPKLGPKNRYPSSKSALITNNQFVIQNCTITIWKAHSEHKLREMFYVLCLSTQIQTQQQRFSVLEKNLGIKFSWACRECGLMGFKCLNAAIPSCCSRKDRFPVIILVSAIFLLPLPQQLPQGINTSTSAWCKFSKIPELRDKYEDKRKGD